MRLKIIIAGAALCVLAGLRLYWPGEAPDPLYPAMVCQWLEDKAAGIPPEDRAGWPPYRGKPDCKGVSP